MPELRRETFPSPRLGRDAAAMVYVPDLPAGMPEPALVIYLLHGPGGDERAWTGEDPMLRGTLVQAMRDGTLRPSVLVMPSVGRNSWWIDGAADAAGSAFLDDVLPAIEARLGFAVSRERRALLGVSMGGFGALQFALARPDRFCAAALISPTVYDPAPPADSAARRTPQFVRDGRFDEGLWQSVNYPPRLGAYARAGQKVSIWISNGDRDPPALSQGAARLAERLRAISPGHVDAQVHRGGHNWSAFDAALTPALRFIDARCR